MPHAPDLGRSARDARHGRWLLCGVLGAVVSAIRPVILRAHEIRRLLQGLPVLVVRPVKPQPPEWCAQFGYTCFTPAGHISGRGAYRDDPAEKFFRLPFGAPGQRLWVRETWAEVGTSDPLLCVYRADYPACVPPGYSNIPPSDHVRWGSSSCMPRWASRLTVEVETTRALRLHTISEDDAVAAGCEGMPCDCIGSDEHGCTDCMNGGWVGGESPGCEFALLWDSTEGRKPGLDYKSNPFVWAALVRPVEAGNG